MIALPKSGMARTSGDGMEQEPESKVEPVSTKIVEAIESEPKKTESEHHHPTVQQQHLKAPAEAKKVKTPGENSIYRPEQHESISLSPVIPKGKLYPLIPKLVKPKESPQQRPNREPRLVLFEPYKAAVNAIVPQKRKKIVRRNRNNLDINVLVTQMSTLKTSELKLNEETEADPADAAKTEFEKERESHRKEIDELKKQQDHLTAQLKFQVQVNSELKNLLVAAVGEDLQTRVNVLTEDKLQLARALLDTANNLSTHTEQIEYLAGQCEVWRSKFLASSVMVEELARWKADLSQKNSLLTKSNKKMLQLSSQIRDMDIDILKNLKFLAKIKTVNVPSSNIIDLTSECLNILQQLVLHSGIGMPENLNFSHLDNLTEAEKLAIQALENTSQPLMSTDEAFKAIVGQAFPSKDVYKFVVSTSATSNTQPEGLPQT